MKLLNESFDLPRPQPQFVGDLLGSNFGLSQTHDFSSLFRIHRADDGAMQFKHLASCLKIQAQVIGLLS